MCANIYVTIKKILFANLQQIKLFQVKQFCLNFYKIYGFQGLSTFLVCPVQSEECPKGSGSVILLRPKLGLVPPKHDVISMPTQQYTNTKHIPMERYHPVVSIMLSYMNRKKAFGEKLCCREVKIDKILGGDLPYFSLKCDNLP